MNERYVMMTQADKKVELCLECFTPLKAKTWGEENRFDLQRPLNQARVMLIADEICAGRWAATTKDPVIVAVTPTGNRIIDGQHRLAAIEKAGQTVWLKVEYWRIPSESQIMAIYATMDDLKKPHTAKDGLHSMRTGATIGVPDGLLPRVLTGIRTIARGFQKISPIELRGVTQSGKTVRVSAVFFKNAIERDFVLRTWGPQIYAYSLAVGNVYGSRALKSCMWTGAVVSVALPTFRWQPAIATEFWRNVAEMNSAKGTAAHLLFSYLTEYPASAVSSADTELHLWKISAAWNSYFEDRPLKILKTKRENAAVRIGGTPIERNMTPAQYFSIATEPEKWAIRLRGGRV